MRNLLLLLLLANILYFVWGTFVRNNDEPGVAVVAEADLGPPMAVSTGHDANVAASVGAVLGSGVPSDLEAVVGRSCVTIGPFRANTDAETALTEYAGEGMRTVLRSAHGEIFVGHWVQIRNIADNQTANDMLERLHDGALSDAYLVTSEDEGLYISLGLFGDVERAEKVELQAKSLDLPADITPKTREGTMFFVDIGLPPGRGAGAMIEKYGESKVLLRDAATCPQQQ
jgi:hypothetical protein